MRLTPSLLAILLFVLSASTGFAQQADPGEKLGQVNFPVSCSPAVQKPFERAVTLQHSFWYLEALKGFTAVTQTDPDCAARKYDSGRHTAPFAIGAMEARYAMERGRWSDGAVIEPRQSRFAYADANVHLARAIGAARSGNPSQARAEVDKLASLRDALGQAKNPYWAEQVEIQRRAAAAWVDRAEGRNEEALALLRSTADLEDAAEKHNITPGPIVRARELLGDLLLELGQPGQAAREYETALPFSPNRFKALHGVSKGASLAGDREKAKEYYAKLLAVAAQADTERPELREAKAFLGK